MEAIEKLHSYRVYTYGKAAATLATAGVSFATGSLAAAVTAVGLSILFASQKLTAAFQPKSLLSHSFVKLALSAALATIVALAYLSLAGVPLVAAEVAYIASLFVIPTLAEICIEAASVALSSKKIFSQTKTISPLFEWVNLMTDYRDIEKQKGKRRAAELMQEHPVLLLLMEEKDVPVQHHKGDEWEAFQAITNFKLRAEDAKTEGEEAALKEEALKVVLPYLRRGSICALSFVGELYTVDTLMSVAEQYEGLHIYSFFLAKALLRSADEQQNAEGRKLLQSLVEKGSAPAMIFLTENGNDHGFHEAFIESTRKRVLKG